MNKVVVKKDTTTLPLNPIPKKLIRSDSYVKAFITGGDTGGVLSAGWYEQKSGDYDWTLEYDEFVFVLKGEMIVKDLSNGRTYTLEEGDMGFFGKGTSLNYSVGKNGLKSMFCTVPPWESTLDKADRFDDV